MCWRKAWLYQSAKNITMECYMIPRYSYVFRTDESTIGQLFSLHSWHFLWFFILLDSVGPVSLLHISGWRELPGCFRLPTRTLDTETFHRSCRQLWLHSIWLWHQELHRQKSSRVRDASSSHKGRGLIQCDTHTIKSALMAFMETYCVFKNFYWVCGCCQTKISLLTHGKLTFCIITA